MELKTYRIICPYCCEQVDIDIEDDVVGRFVQDCAVCCQPWQIFLTDHDGRRDIEVARAQ